MTAELVDLTARRRRGDLAVALVAAAPVRYVPPAFLLALECVDVDVLPIWTSQATVTPLRAVAGAH